MKNFLCAILCLFLFISQAQAQTAIWAASDRSATTTEMRFPVDTSSSSSPGLLRIEPANQNGIYFNSGGRVFASALLFDSAGSLFLSGAAQYCDENGANCFDPSEVGGALQNLVEDLSPQLGANLDLNSFVITGLEIGTDIQAFDAVLDDLAALAVIADNEFIVGTGAGTYANESGATVRTSLGLTIGTDVQAFDTNLEDLSALAVVADNEIAVGTGAGTYSFESGATLLTSIGADPIGTDNSTDVTLSGALDYITIIGQDITRNAIDLTTDTTGDLAVTDGGTGSSTAGGARTNLGLVIGTDVQAFDTNLEDIAALAIVADNELMVGTGVGTYAFESGATLQTSLGLVIGTDVQAWDEVLDDLSALAVIADNEIIVGTGAGTYANEGGATARTSLGLAIGTDVQAFDAVLEDLAALAVIADNEFIVGTGAGTYANESGATVRTSLGLVIGTDVQAFDTNLEDIAALAVVADNEVMIGTGVGTYAFESGATLLTSIGALANVVEDTTPQLGGDLDGQNNIFENVGAIRYQSSRNQPSCTTALEGTIFYNSALNNFNFCDDVGSVQIFSTGGAGLANIVEDTTPQLGGDLDLNGNVITGLEIGTDIQAWDADLDTLATEFDTADATDAAHLKFAEDTDNGANSVTLIGPASTADVVVTLPAATTTLVGDDTTDTLTTKSMAAGSNTFTEFVWDTNIFADGTDGQIPTFDANGEPAFVATGTAAQVLTSNGAGTAPTFQAAAGGGAWTLLATATASNSATIDFTSLIDSTFEEYVIKAIDVVPATDVVEFWVRTDSDAGASFDTGANDYEYTVGGIKGDSVLLQIGNDTTSNRILVANITLGNAAGESFNTTIHLWNPAGTKFTLISAQSAFVNNDGRAAQLSSTGFRESAADVDAVRLLMSSGNITSGEFKLYGVKK